MTFCSKVLLSAFALFALGSCSEAESLGDEPPIEFQIQGSPSWENGIGNLIAVKCAYCHAHPKPAEAPNQVVADLDLRHYETERLDEGRVIRGGDAIGRWIHEGILDQGVEIFAETSKPRKMPLDYGTPLTEREKGYLRAWSAAGSPKGMETQPEGLASAGRANYFIYCGQCHGTGSGQLHDNGQEWLGPGFRKEAVTLAKIRSMWLSKTDAALPEPQELANLRAYILSRLE